MTETHQRILARLRVKHRGHQNAIKRTDLAAIIGISLRTLRKCLTEIDEQVDEEICRDNFGIYIGVTLDELKRNESRYHSMGVRNITTGRRRKKKLQKAEEVPQGRLFA